MTRVVVKAKNGIDALPLPGPPSMDTDLAVADALRSTGLALLDQLPTRQDVLDAAADVMHITPHRDSDPDGLTVIRDTGRHTGREGFAGLSNGEVLPHTERSSLATPPRLMMLVCARPATTGGQCLLADGHAVYADLAEDHPDALAALSEPRSAFFGGRDGHLGSVFTPRPDGRPQIRLRWDSLARFSPLAQPYLPVLRAAIARRQRTLTLAAGQGYVLDNTRWLHARTAFTGPRLCYRALGEPKDVGP
ncbi:TauD/TfdA family dioxygenase [Streptomyces bobili]|uniref:TauD/TfdA family dioxygenase n=1 Tax=Streptomyces bobili TaxID=67280 RepID=UPI0036E7416A